MMFICPDSLNMYSLSSYKKKRTAGHDVPAVFAV